MFPKSPIRQMYPNRGQQSYTPYPIPQLPPMAQKRKVSLLNSLKTRSNRTFHANGPSLSTNGRATDDAPTTAAPISTATAIPTTIYTTISAIHAAISRADDTTSNV